MQFGATILDAEGHRLTAEEKALFRDVRPFGFIVFARNVDNSDQLRALCDDFREAAGHDCLITVDQEGGRVQRLRAPMAREWLPALDHANRAGAKSEPAMYLRARLIANELLAHGIDSNCAPVCDIASDKTHPFLRNRCYGETLEQVVSLARATAQGHLDGGVLPVMKHLPGHGRATQDSHHDLPHVTAPREFLQQNDFAAFAALKDLPMGMTCHLVFDAYDNCPTTLSPRMLEVIRQDIGFDGLIMTDDISMKALSGTPETVARDALKAGCDVALFCNGDLSSRAAVAEAAGGMSEVGQLRAERALARRQTPTALDIEAVEADLSALMGGQVYG